MTNKILCDTDFLVGLYLNQDSNHTKAQVLFEKYSGSSDFMIMNLTKYEFSTVLSRKLPQLEAVKIYKEFTKDFQDEIWFEISWEAEVFDLYNSFEKKNISFFDCACQIVASKISAKVASFDSFYLQEILA